MMVIADLFSAEGLGPGRSTARPGAARREVTQGVIGGCYVVRSCRNRARPLRSVVAQRVIDMEGCYEIRMLVELWLNFMLQI